jgi:translation initiation factor 2B subunit (eIF-2B alpha/beta/delta family)
MKDLCLKICVLESRPRCEGATFASQLISKISTKPLEEQQAGHKHLGQDTLWDQNQSNQNIKLVVAPDSHVCNLARNIDIVLIGADRISASGDVSNKMGSYAAVLCTKHISPSAKVIVLSETDKIARSGSTEEHTPENNDPSEVISAWDDETQQHIKSLDRNQFAVENIYFEWVPASCIDIYLTEQGVLDRAKIREISAHKEQLEWEFFDEDVIKMADEL